MIRVEDTIQTLLDWVDFGLKATRLPYPERERGIVYICIGEVRAIQRDTRAIIYRYRVNLEVMVRRAKTWTLSGRTKKLHSSVLELLVVIVVLSLIGSDQTLVVRGLGGVFTYWFSEEEVGEIISLWCTFVHFGLNGHSQGVD